jgi:hypothetical protein
MIEKLNAREISIAERPHLPDPRKFSIIGIVTGPSSVSRQR